MADTLTPEQRSERMSAIRAKDTKPELWVRRFLHNRGYRYRLHLKDLPGKPDLVFPGRKKVIFVHGCFWHRHPDPDCKLARLPKSRVEFWTNKLTGNRERDLVNQRRLSDAGWQFFVVWECQLRNSEHLENMLVSFLEGDDSCGQ